VSYTPFREMEAKLAKRPGVTNPAGLARFIGARKYGAAKFNHAAATGHSLRHAKPLKKGKHHKQIAAFVNRNQGQR
jgi:hypothetical protein